MATDRRKVLNVSLPLDLYTEIEQMARKESKTKGEFAREALREYVNKSKRWEEIREWGKEAVKKLGVDNEGDVEKIIHQLREEK